MNFPHHLIYLILYKTNSRLKFFVQNKTVGLSQLHANEQSEKYSKHHFYDQESGEIELVIEREEIFEIIKDAHSLRGEVFPCCKHVHIGIRYHDIFLGFSLCEMCTSAVDSMSMVPLVIVNARTGGRHRLQLQLLK